MEEAAHSSGEPHLARTTQVRAPEDGRDLLTCGQCSQAFPLAHILAFIQHKQGGCVSRNQASDATPPSPAGRTGRQRVAEPQPGFIELRRGTSSGRSRGEELSKSGEAPQQGGRLLMSDSVVVLCVFFFFFQPSFYSFNNRSSSLSSPAH